MLEALLAGVLGLIIGSFLNVCVYRMPRDLSVIRPARSFCPGCETTIPWYDNIPVLSYLWLGAKCRKCRTGISLRYPIVEFVTGALFFGIVAWFGPKPLALKLCVFAAIQVALIAMDFEERILADEFTVGGLLVGLVFAWFVPMPPTILALFFPESVDRRYIWLGESILGATMLSSVLFSIGFLYEKLRGREGLGFGDVKMVGMIGAFLGLPAALLTVVVGSILGTLSGVVYILLTKKEMSTYELPFGSFLGLAALLVAIYTNVTIL